MDGFRKAGLMLGICGFGLFTGPVLAEPAHTAQGEERTVKLADRNGQDAGTAKIVQTPGGLMIDVEISGVPEGWHGFHIHETGDCSDPQDGFRLAGGHVKVTPEERHGFLDEVRPHAGDLPNIWADETGSGHAQFFTERINTIVLDDQDGSTFVLNGGPDDYSSDPDGDLGARVACGVIYPMKT